MKENERGFEMDAIPYKLQQLCTEYGYSLEHVLLSAGTVCYAKDSFEDKFGKEFGEFYEFCAKYGTHTLDFGSRNLPKYKTSSVSRMSVDFHTLHDFPIDVRVELTPFVASHLSDCYFLRVSAKTTLCVLRFKNGFEVTGKSACIDFNDFDAHVGAKFSLRDAVNNAGDVVGFLNQELMHRGDKYEKDTVS